MTLAAFLSSLATALASLSPSSELLSAFSAFDDDDDGQVDAAELRDALLNTAPDAANGGRALAPHEVDRVLAGFGGRRAFSRKNMMAAGPAMAGGGRSPAAKRGDVFKYQDFVREVAASGNGANEKADGGEADD